MIDQNMKRILDESLFGVYVVRKDRTILYWNKQAELITGRSAEEIVGTRCPDSGLDHLSSTGEHMCNYFCPLLKVLKDGQIRSIRALLKHKKGYRVPVEARFIPLYNKDNELTEVLEEFRPVNTTDMRRNLVRDFNDASVMDEITGLPNHQYLSYDLDYRIMMHAQTGQNIAVLSLHIDDFQTINEQWGREAGDAVLRAVGRNLRNTVREGDLIGRWSGAEFLGVFNVLDQDDCKAITRKAKNALHDTLVEIDGQRIPILASISAVMIHGNDTAETLVKRAEESLKSGA
jgi:two-component system cell cycle response regulator